ncbi:MAG: anthranilate synthase component I family protein [Deltaproteobacteria bacterium]|nr:MAG: anthranilate synthase component I family protein [Deltaproteobacteria bacterium]
MKPQFTIAADLDTPVSAWLKLTPFRPRFLLESVVGGEQVARYSFLGFGDVRTIRLEGEHLIVDGEAIPVGAGQEALLDALRAALDDAPRPGPADGLPFAGGLVGVAAYDIVRRFERVPSGAAPLEGHPEGAWMAPRSMLVFDHATRRVAVLHDGPEEERLALEADILDALRFRVPRIREGGTVGPATPTMSKEQFLAGVEAVKEYIAAGDVYQLVLSVGFEGETDLDPFQVYRALRLLNPSPYMVFMDMGDFQVIGSSPEALVRLHGETATLRPIAGTRPRGKTPEEDVALEEELLADPKEASEHVMLVDLARNDLGRVATAGTVGVEPYRIIERYSHVMHIVSGVNGKLRDGIDQFDLFAATFPAGTVVGAPKVRAMEIIDELEPIRRGIYAGTVGYFGHNGAMDQAIAIRTLVMRDGKYRVQAGAGLVADSVPEMEHREVMAKSEALRKALALAAEGL